MMSLTDICGACVILFLVTFFWQHLGRSYQWVYTPNFLFHIVADVCEQEYTRVGACLAWCSGYMHTIIDNLGNLWHVLEELWITLDQLMSPMWRICMAPCRIVTGYIMKARSYATPGYIILGTLGLLWLPAFIWCYLQPPGTFFIPHHNGDGQEITGYAFLIMLYFCASASCMLWFGDAYLNIMVTINRFLNGRPAPRRQRQPRAAGGPGGAEFH